MQLFVKIPLGPLSVMLLHGTAILPADLYVIPRFLIFLDAQHLDHPANPRKLWKETFEIRWTRNIAAKLLLYFALGLGTSMLIFPGLLALLFLGWMPFRVLLRGEGLVQAARSSALLSARRFPAILMGSLPLFLIYLPSTLAIAFFLDQRFPHPTPWDQLTKPLFWAARGVIGVFDLWLSTSLLALFHHLEPAPAQPPAEENTCPPHS